MKTSERHRRPSCHFPYISFKFYFVFCFVLEVYTLSLRYFIQNWQQVKHSSSVPFLLLHFHSGFKKSWIPLFFLILLRLFQIFPTSKYNISGNNGSRLLSIFTFFFQHYYFFVALILLSFALNPQLGHGPLYSTVTLSPTRLRRAARQAWNLTYEHFQTFPVGGFFRNSGRGWTINACYPTTKTALGLGQMKNDVISTWPSQSVRALPSENPVRAAKQKEIII